MLNWGFSLQNNDRSEYPAEMTFFSIFHLTFSLRISIGGPISKATTLPFGKISARLRVVSPESANQNKISVFTF